MKKYWKLATIVTVLVAVVALVGVTAIYAQGPANNGAAGQPTNGTGLANESGLGLMAVDEADMHAAIADALGMSLDEFEAAIAAGETPATLALARGIDLAVIQEAMAAAHNAAFAQAVADGLITQEQADWILSHRGGHAGQSGSARGTGNAGSSNGYGTGTGECTQ